MPNNFFITGNPKAGKTTLVMRIAKELLKRGFKVGGFVSPEKAERGTREGFYVVDLETGETTMLAKVNNSGPKVGKYNVNVKEFESIALPPLEHSEKYDILVIDEIGKMELESAKFSDALADVLQKNIPIIASLHRKYLQTYEIYGTVYDLTGKNSGAVYTDILNEIEKMKKRTGQKLAFAKTKVSKRQIKKERGVKPRKKAKIKPADEKRIGLVEKVKSVLGL